MRIDTENMPSLSYNQLRVEKTVEDEVKAECYDDAMTSEFSQFEENTVLLVHNQLMVDKPIEEQVRIDITESLIERTGEETENNSIFLAAVGSARVQVNLLVDPVLHGWTKTLRIINYLLALPKKLKHRFHLIQECRQQVESYRERERS